jgi:outer membrane protein TolC
MNNVVPSLAFTLVLVSLSGTAHGEESSKTLTAAEAVSIALKNNPSLAAVASQVKSAKASVDSEEGRYKPTLLVNAGVTRTQTPSITRNNVLSPVTNQAIANAEVKKHLSFGTDVSVKVETTRTTQQTLFNPSEGTLFQSNPGYGLAGRLTVTQPLLRGFGRDVNLASLDAAKLQEESSGHQRDQSASQLVRDVLLSYWDLWYAGQSSSIERAARDVAVKQRDDTRARIATGSVAPVDVLSFETQIATREESIAAAELEQQTRRTELERLLGQSLREAGPSDALTPPAPAAPIGNLVEEAEAQSPEIQQLKTALELAETQAKTAADAYRARLDVEGYVQGQGLTSQNTTNAYQLGSGVSGHVGVIYELPLAGGRRSAEFEKSQLAVEVARNNLAAARQRLTADITKAQQQLTTARRKLELSQSTTKIAEDQLAAEQARYRTGTSTPFQVVQAEDQVRSARLRVARARVDLVQAHVALLHNTGRLLKEAI